MSTQLENELLSPDDRTRIRSAVQDAEGRTSGEIVPYLVKQSDSYEVAIWRGASAFALLALIVLLLYSLFYEGWGAGWLLSGWGFATFFVGSALAGAVFTMFISPLKRLFAGSDIQERVHARALSAFVEEEVFLTKDRTGILLFVSFLERRIEVIGDAGINARVSEKDWQAVIKRIRKGIRKNDLAGGLVDAIHLCGELLERKQVTIEPDDTNELSDDIRIREN